MSAVDPALIILIWHEVETETVGSLPIEELVEEVARRASCSIDDVLSAVESVIDGGTLH